MRKTKGIFTEPMELDEKQTPSDKIFHITGLWCGALACALLLSNLILFYAAQAIAAMLWTWIFYPVLILVIGGIFCSSSQLFRNPYFSSILAFVMNISAVVAAISVVIVQAVVYTEVLIIPFIWF